MDVVIRFAIVYCAAACLLLPWFSWVKRRGRCRDCEEHQDNIATLNAEAQAAPNRGDRWRFEDDADRARGWYELHILETHPAQAEQRRRAYEDAFHAHLADREEADRDG